MVVAGVVNTNRGRDLMPTFDGPDFANGPSDKFLKFLADELIPQLTSEYSLGKYHILLGHSKAHAAKISGTISATLTISEDSQLSGDVTCTVTGAACLTFAVSRVTLDLNGYTLTVQADALTACNGSSTGGES